MSPSPTPPPPRTPIKTRFLILSDTHSSDPSQNATNASPYRPPLPRADVLLHCGDLTMLGHLDEYERTLAMLARTDAPLKLVIAGNHDITLDATYYARMGPHMHGARYEADLPARARTLWTGDRARRAGVTYLEEGRHAFVLGNGARLGVWASPYQPEFCNYAFPYPRHEDRYNLPHQCAPGATPVAEHPVPDWQAAGGVDVVMTHGPPMGVLDAVRNGEHVGCEHLLRAVARCRPKLHCFGHIHEGWGAQKVGWAEGGNLDVRPEERLKSAEAIKVDWQRMEDERAAFVDISHAGDDAVAFGRETLMVNASIMSITYKPVQGPWLVDMDLERASID